jgi:hypothetical protein
MIKTNSNRWTKEEIELIKNVKQISSLVSHPLMIKRGRTYKSIESKLYYMSIKEMASNDFKPKTHKSKRLLKAHTSQEKKLLDCSENCLNCDVCDLSCE